jgi:hypothetical protein
VPRIDIAERPGVDLAGRPRPTEDRVVLHVDDTASTAVVLDGATEVRPGLPSGGWYSRRLADAIEARLRSDPTEDLGALLAHAIGAVARDHDLVPRRSPSSTVAMLRFSADDVEALVLADSPVVVYTADGPEIVLDDRLDRLRAAGALRTRAAVDALRNDDAGFWVAEAVPEAATRALRRRWPREEVDAAVLATDGVSVGIDTYGVLSWADLLSLARTSGADAVLETVRDAELADADCRRWPRSKRHDDQALVVIDFAVEQG